MTRSHSWSTQSNHPVPAVSLALICGVATLAGCQHLQPRSSTAHMHSSTSPASHSAPAQPVPAQSVQSQSVQHQSVSGQTAPPAISPSGSVQSQTPDSSSSASPRSASARPDSFSVTGKIGVRIVPLVESQAGQSGSAFYAWNQVSDRFAMDLTGALGIGQTHIEGIPGKVSLNSAKTGLLTADSPEALLQQATGWIAPISFLPNWIHGVANRPESPQQHDAQGRLGTLTEGGWQVNFDYAVQTDRYPNRLIMTKDDDQFKTRVTLTVQTRSTQ